MNPARVSFCLLLVSLLSLPVATQGCVGPTYTVQQYSGPRRSAETIGIIRIIGKDGILLDSVDGEEAGADVPEDSKLQVEVLPGRHSLGVRAFVDSVQIRAVASFLAEAGKVYRVVFVRVPATELEPASAGARVYEIDRDTDQLIRDVTLPKASEEHRGVPAPAGSAKPLELEREPGGDAAPPAVADAGTD